MGFLAMLIGMLIGAAAAALVVLGWAATQIRWLSAHCNQQITYWRKQVERREQAERDREPSPNW